MIQYPKQVHTTLPSVEGGLGSMNIIKDPPKSFFTKRRDKVSDTQEITNMIGEFSGDRICEMIKVYPRGINPMVSVSYSNYGTNGGQYRGVTNAGKWGHNKMLNDGRSAYIGQAKLPIPLIDNGAFRPPVLTQYDLLPLSRLPRSNTKAWTQPCFISYAESVECPSSDKIRQIEQNNIHYKVNPTATFTIGQLLEEPSDIRQVFEPVHYSADSRLRSRDITLHNNSDVNGRIIDEMLKGDIKLNKSAQRSVEYIVQDVNPEYYTSDVIVYDVSSGKSFPKAILPEGELRTNYMKDSLNSNVSTNKNSTNILGMKENLPGRTTIQSILTKDVKTNKSSNKVHRLEENYQGRTNIQDAINVSANSGIKLSNADPLKENYDYKLQKVIPEYSLEAPKSSNIQVINFKSPYLNKDVNEIQKKSVIVNSNLGGKDLYELNSRNKHIKPTLNLSEHKIDGKGTKPILYRVNDDIKLNKPQKLSNKKQVRFNF